MDPASQTDALRYTPFRCLVTGSKLRAMTYDECAAINVWIHAGKLFNRLGQRVTQPLQAALVDEHHQWAYRIENDIPQLLSSEALQLSPDEPSAAVGG